MFFWNSLVFSLIQWMLAIWSLVPLPFLKPAWTYGSSRVTYCVWSRLENFEHYFASVRDECNCVVVWTFSALWDWNGKLTFPKFADKTWFTGEGNGKPLQYSCLENAMNSMKRQKERTLKGKLPRSVGVQYATGEEWRNNSRKNEEAEPKWKCPVVDVTGDGSKVQCYKEQYCIGTWNVRSMNQGKFSSVQSLSHVWFFERVRE